MKKNVWTVLGLVLAVVMLAIGIVAKVKGGCTAMIECTSGAVPMKCHWTYIAVFYTGIVGAIIALASTFMSERQGRLVGVIAVALTALLTIVLISPLGIGTCSHADSMCNDTAVIEYVLAAISIVLSLALAIKSDPDAAEKPKQQL